MALRPCDNCGGSGDEMEDSLSALGVHGGEVAVGPCERCKDMPWLPAIEECGCFQPLCMTDEIWQRGKFRPDPDSIMWWCNFLRLGVRYPPEPGERTGLPDFCDLEHHNPNECGWVAIERLETVE